VNYIAIILNKTKTNLILQTITTITAIKTTPATVTPQIRPTQILIISLGILDNE
jgi:hypothetical protein